MGATTHYNYNTTQGPLWALKHLRLPPYRQQRHTHAKLRYTLPHDDEDDDDDKKMTQKLKLQRHTVQAKLRWHVWLQWPAMVMKRASESRDAFSHTFVEKLYTI
jgi:hypothetical protein